MTLPDQRYRSLMQTKTFLYDLCNPEKTPRVPKVIRQRAIELARHFPVDYILEDMTELAPQYFAKEMEPLYRMVKQHEQDKQNETGT
jgi:hypothetical protein